MLFVEMLKEGLQIDFCVLPFSLESKSVEEGEEGGRIGDYLEGRCELFEEGDDDVDCMASVGEKSEFDEGFDVLIGDFFVHSKLVSILLLYTA